MDDYHAFKSTGGGSDNNKGSGGGGYGWDFGCGWVVIVIGGYMLLHFIFSGASWEAIEGLLFWGILAFLFARSLFR
ncbi:MAG: hypothetical protein IKZ25_03025 [Clostridia bacterium]|nr:hypothetical protein [Clostridia bacterium]